jgi:hypothetical protein
MDRPGSLKISNQRLMMARAFAANALLLAYPTYLQPDLLRSMSRRVAGSLGEPLRNKGNFAQQAQHDPTVETELTH